MRYEIRLAGRLPRNWTDWADGWTATSLETGETVLSGSVPDQAALIGLLSAIAHMNLTILSVRRLESAIPLLVLTTRPHGPMGYSWPWSGRCSLGSSRCSSAVIAVQAW